MPTDPHFDKFIVFKGVHWDVYVSERGRNNLGRLYVWLHRDGIIDYDDLTDEERKELLQLFAKFKKILKDLFDFDGPLNFAYLANNESHKHHCHYHIVPRYKEPRTFEGVEFVDPTWGTQWKSAMMDEELALALKDKIKAVLN